MSDEDLARALNEWMRYYTEEPDEFASDMATVKKFLSEDQAGQEPSYGVKSVAFLHKMLDRLDAKKAI